MFDSIYIVIYPFFLFIDPVQFSMLLISCLYVACLSIVLSSFEEKLKMKFLLIDQLLGASQLCFKSPMEEKQASGFLDSVVQFHNVGSKDGCEAPHKWSFPGGGNKIDVKNQIFCNRSLNMKNIIAVGFDMDYTLAQYKSETFESLAYEGTVKKLVYDLGYPSEVSIIYFCFEIVTYINV